jgi:hypothetical protein
VPGTYVCTGRSRYSYIDFQVSMSYLKFVNCAYVTCMCGLEIHDHIPVSCTVHTLAAGQPVKYVLLGGSKSTHTGVQHPDLAWPYLVHKWWVLL